MLRLPTMFTNMRTARLVLTRFGPNLTLNKKTLRPLTASNTAFNQEQQREFKNFGHKPDPVPAFSKFYYAFIGLSIVGLTLNWKGIKKFIFPAVEAKAKVVKDSEVLKDEGNEFPKEEKLKDEGNEFVKDEAAQDGSINEKCISDTSKDDLKKGKAGFRERKIIEYENRMRSYSTPDKIFRYFATVRMAQDNSAEIYMTPDDFLRAITPGERQPDGLGLDQFRKYDPKNIQVCMNLALEPDSIFYKLGSAGLITFSDYIFLLTVLSTSRRHFEIAFRMFDLNGDGDVDCEEFEKVATLVRSQTSIGSRHRDHANTGNTFKGVNSALTTYFFGPEKDRKLTITRFLDFQTQLQREILTLEFKRKEPNEEGKISELAFAELLVAYAGYLPKKKAKLMKRVKKTFRDHGQGISKQDYLDFFHFLNNINDVDTALTFYHIAGAAIDQATLKHVARTVAQVELSDHVINVVYTIFDEDGDNQLSNKEFVSVMKNRLLRGLEKPKDIGFVKFIQSFIKCAKVAKPAILDI